MPQPEEDPPRKVYGFKDREFKRDNATGPAAAPPSAKELAMMAGPVVKSPRGATGPKADDPNDVYAAMQQNRTVEKAHGMDTIEIRKVKSRRKRDYWILMIGGNLVIVLTVLFAGPNVVSVLFGFAGVIMFSLSATWIMWQIMDRY
jgi:uncharacterized integral membrane protein